MRVKQIAKKKYKVYKITEHRYDVTADSFDDVPRIIPLNDKTYLYKLLDIDRFFTILRYLKLNTRYDYEDWSRIVTVVRKMSDTRCYLLIKEK